MKKEEAAAAIDPPHTCGNLCTWLAKLSSGFTVWAVVDVGSYLLVLLWAYVEAVARQVHLFLFRLALRQPSSLSGERRAPQPVAESHPTH